MTDNNCPHCGMSPGNCYAICPSQGLAEWERHHEQHVAPFSRDHLTEGRGDPDFDHEAEVEAKLRVERPHTPVCEDWNCGGSCQSDPGTDIFDGRATGYRVHLGSVDRDPDQQLTERQYDAWIADDACQVCYLADATCRAFGKRTCERCQDEQHRYAATLPRHPAEQMRHVVIAGHAVHHSLRSWVELWAYGKPMPTLTDAHVAQVDLDAVSDDIPF